MKDLRLCYALLTTHCNLSCPHCDVKNNKEHWDRDKFMQQLHDFDGEIILFGGEPTLYKDRLIDVFLSDPIVNRKITSITTNMMSIDDTILTILQMIKGIGSSYSPDRFTDDEYQIWLNNINEFGKKVPGKTMRIISTMTEALLAKTPDEMIKIISEWNSSVITEINFEHYIGPEVDKNYFERCDQWLCDVYNAWNSPIKIYNIKRIRGWYNDCTNIVTLHPDGSITHGCPHNSKTYMLNECYSCEKVAYCRPCRLQKYCSFSHKFAELTKNDTSYQNECGC